MKTPEIKTILARIAADHYKLDALDFEVSYPESKYGDISANIAFKLAKPLKAAPQAIATELAALIKHKDIASAEAVAGYINVTFTAAYWVKQLHQVNKSFGSIKPSADSRKVQVEFISANPTGPTTFGNARGGFVGDVIARVLKTQGHDVTREYYFNDGGTQIRKLVESVKVSAGLIEAEEVQYKGTYVDELALEFKDQLQTASDDEAGLILTQAILKRHIEPAVAKMNIHFDTWFNERSLAETGETDEAFALLKAQDLIYEQDGATWLASSRLGDERDRVLRKSSGDLTYLANDIAYHLNIFTKRDFDWAIKQWGADHAGQVPSLKLIMQALTPEKQLDFNIHQWVRLIQDGKEVKMSKRAGTYVTVEEVIDEVGTDVARFFFLMRSGDSSMDFDLDLAREQSQKNPLFYVMYAYARANSILDKAKTLDRAPQIASYANPSSYELELIRKMAQWPELLSSIAADFQVQRLTHYGMELAGLFQKFYEEVNILKLAAEEASGKLWFVSQYVVFMSIYFETLGITPQERMTREDQAISA